MLYYLLALVVCFNSIIASIQYEEKLQPLVQLAREYRLHPHFTPEEEELRKLEIVDKSEKLLVSYGKVNRLKDAVNAFVQDAISGSFHIEDARDSNMGGSTEDEVFFITEVIADLFCPEKSMILKPVESSSDAATIHLTRSTPGGLAEENGLKWPQKGDFNGQSSFAIASKVNGELVYVIKAFKNAASRRGRFLRELSGLDLLIQLDLKESSPIYPLALASCVYEGEHYVLLLETAAKGKRLDQYVKNHCYPLAQKAYAQTGRAFAELHATTSAQLTPIPVANIKKMAMTEAEVFSNVFILEAVAKQIPIDVFKKYLEIAREEALQLNIFYSYSHGDAHSENVFYDQDTNKVSFIDLVRLHCSVDFFGQPIQDRADDLMHMENNFRKLALLWLQPEESERLLDSFFLAYEETAGSFPCAAHLTFYRNYFNLRRLLSRIPDENVFNMVLQYFTEQSRLVLPQAEKTSINACMGNRGRNILRHHYMGGR